MTATDDLPPTFVGRAADRERPPQGRESFATGLGGLPPSLGDREPAPHGELLIDCEEDRTLRAVLVGMLREAERWELISDLEDRAAVVRAIRRAG